MHGISGDVAGKTSPDEFTGFTIRKETRDATGDILYDATKPVVLWTMGTKRNAQDSTKLDLRWTAPEALAVAKFDNEVSHASA